jgi:hypothetical protein
VTGDRGTTRTGDPRTTSAERAYRAARARFLAGLAAQSALHQLEYAWCPPAAERAVTSPPQELTGPPPADRRILSDRRHWALRSKHPVQEREAD